MHQDTKVAWGLYASNCSDVDTFTDACIGCSDAGTTFGVAIVDELPPSARASCSAVPNTFATGQLLRLPPSWATTSAPNATRALSVLNWSKTRALLQLLIAIFPLAECESRQIASRSKSAGAPKHAHSRHAALTVCCPNLRRSCAFAGYVKVDTDTFLNVRQLRATLLWHLPLNAPMPDYVGRALRLFSFRGSPLTYMQGGAFVLSRRAAAWLPQWEPGEWNDCPNRVLRDVNDPATDRLMRSSCFVRQTSDYAEDLYVGIAMHEARPNLSAMNHPCFLTIRKSPNTTGNLFRDMAERRIKRFCNGCPVTVHPLKGRNLFEVRRLADGCPRGRAAPLPMSGRAKRSRARGALP